MSNLSLRNTLYGACPRPLRPYWDRVEASDTGSRLARGAFWSLCGAIVSRGMMLLAFILVARTLGREIYGEFGIIRSTVNMFVVFAGFGLGLTATKHVAELRTTDPSRAGRIMALSDLFAMGSGAITAIGLLIFAPWLAQHTINAPHLAGELRIGGIILFINAVNGAQTGSLAGFEAFKAIAKINLGVGLSAFPLLVGGAHFGGLRGAVCALAVNMVINWLLNHLALRKEIARHKVSFSYKGCIIEWPILWQFSLPAALSSSMVIPVMWACNAILVNQPGGYVQMGLFDAADQWKLATLFIPTTAGRIVLPMLSNLHSLNDQRTYQKVLKLNILLNGGLALAVALPISVLAPWIMRSYGEGFEHGKWVLVFLALTSVLMAVNSVIGQAIASKGRMWIGMLFNALWAGALLIFSFVLLRQNYGAMGLAFGNFVAYLLHTIWQSLYMIRIIRS